MCGIVGYCGLGNGIDPVLEGLKRLEYRGYDSAGISFKDNEGLLKIYKEEGKLENLVSTLDKVKPTSSLVIGHTRWATHGAVNQINAHPHGNDEYCLVHNGIVENAEDLKLQLEAEGFKFSSDTDTEVFLVLLEKFSKDHDTVTSVAKAFEKVRGNSAFVVIHQKEQKLYFVKRAAPLVCGEMPKTEEAFVSSDPYALVGFCETIYFPEDNVIGVSQIKAGKVGTEFFEMDGSISSRYMSQKSKVEHQVATKGQFEHFMLKEIHEQPILIQHLLEYYESSAGEALLEKVRNIKPEFIHIIGCGTAWHAGLCIKNFIERKLNIRVNVELASEFRYRKPIVGKNDLGIFISQSGETADTLACLQLLKKQGVSCLGILNVEGSTIFRECDYNFMIQAGPEIGVASTKAFTQMVLVGYLFTSYMAGEDKATRRAELETINTTIKNVIDRAPEILEISRDVYNHKGFIFTGRTDYFPIALEGALKLKEIAYVHAEGYAAGELKHGPIALIDEDMVNVAILGPELFEKAYSNAQEVKARRGVMITVGPTKLLPSKNFADWSFDIGLDKLESLSPVAINIFMQIFSYYIAKLKGTDIDKPRNLAKSVTVE